MKKVLTALLVTTALSGCIPAAIVAGTAGVSTATQERTAGERLDDNGIALAINKKFIQKDKDLFAAVATDVREGRVLLTGKVDSPITKKDAEEMAWRIQGVREVINEIKVTNEESFGNYVSDAWISNKIRAQMLVTNGIKSQNFGVQTVDRVVYLMGIAQDEKESKVAIEIARRTSNVQRVVSHVIIKNDPRRAALGRAPKPPAHIQNDNAYNSNLHSNDSADYGAMDPIVRDENLPD